jgi:hypothetical protein
MPTHDPTTTTTKTLIPNIYKQQKNQDKKNNSIQYYDHLLLTPTSKTSLNK